MKAVPIPETEQMDAMLNQSVYELACNYYENPNQYDLRRYLTVNRRKLVCFLKANPDKAEVYFQKNKNIQATHDVERIWQEGSRYIVASMFHGQVKSPERFRSLPKAVAEHVLVSYGMY